MTDQDQQDRGPDTGQDEESVAERRSYTTIAILSVVIFIVLAGLMIFYLLSNRSESEEAPTASATDAPTEVAVASDELWTAIQQRGTVVVGTAADYPPFEYYDEDFQIDGLDIAIIEEIGRRLGLRIELRDMAFDGLSNALQLDQIDAAISAITITDQRRQFVDFSDTYFVSADALLANEDAPFNSIPSPNALAGLRLGIERGTVYESWAQTTLIEEGLMSAHEVFEYERMSDALIDLRAGRIDIVALDLQPAQVAVDRGDLKIVAQGLNQQNLGIAVPKGAAEFLARINDTLQGMEDDGTLRTLSAQYTGLAEEAIQPLPDVEPTPGTAITPSPGGCIDSSEYIADLSFDDEGLTTFPVLNAGESFQKGWRLRNSGTCTWVSGYALAPTGGDRMGGDLVLVEQPVAPGEEYEFWVDLVAPIIPGQYVGYWSMRNDQSGLIFGERVSAAIEVTPAPEPTPLPTQTPVPGISFSANPTVIQQGQCSTLVWETQNVQSVYVYQQGENWQVNPAANSGSLNVCPQSTTNYELRAVMDDGSATVRTVTVSVTPNASVPQITRFTVDPPDQVATGQCVTIRWSVDGSVNTVNIARNGSALWSNAPFGGSMPDCPPGPGQQNYTIQATGPGGTAQAAWTINVVSPATSVPTSTPTTIPGTATPGFEPVIYFFQAQPASIPRNNCVTLSWSAGGNATRLSLVRNSVTIQANLPFQSSWTDCSNANVGTVIYLLVAQSNFNQTATQQANVTVTP
jgi:polar amino acid transport system substrate-binding protein